MHIKAVEFHFNTDSEPMVVTGKAAQKMWDDGDLRDNMIRVSMEGFYRYIPRNNIRYIDVVPHEEANELAKEIRSRFVIFRKNVKQSSTEHPLDIWVREDIGKWEIGGGGLDIGYYESDDPLIIQDPKLLAEAQELMEMHKRLDRLISGVKTIDDLTKEMEDKYHAIQASHVLASHVNALDYSNLHCWSVRDGEAGEYLRVGYDNDGSEVAIHHPMVVKLAKELFDLQKQRRDLIDATVI